MRPGFSHFSVLGIALNFTQLPVILSNLPTTFPVLRRVDDVVGKRGVCHAMFSPNNFLAGYDKCPAAASSQPAHPRDNAANPQDASRLLDLCRQSIIFDSLAGVADCLNEIAQDSSVRIVQVAAQLAPISESVSPALCSLCWDSCRLAVCSP